MSDAKIALLEKALNRERLARKAAEKILEDKSLELYQTNQNLRNVLSEKEIHLESLFKTIVDPYILMDLYGNVLKMNDASQNFFGYTDTFNVTKSLYKEDVPYAMESYATLLKQGTFKNFRARVYNKDKELRWIEINSSLVYNEANEPVFAHGIVRDITEDLTAQKEREELLNHLTISNKELNDFAHVVSHDLKAPLRSMNALVTWLHEDFSQITDNEDIEKNFQLLIKKIDKMDHLINGILKYAGVDKIERADRQVDLDFVVGEITETIHVPNHVKIDIPYKLPTIRGDKFRLHQLFQNLISNAIKYAKEDNGLVTVSYTDKEEYWEFRIQDNGKGIEEKYHKKIFDIFQTLDDHHNSTGIGLAIVTKIIALYQGKIWVESELGKGATFIFLLPK
ncbi:sensor histidine kinase [Tenacibaculum jejuense]|uniref:histidine kinase n=1 Tax=Tenacibaculum jejuense TaxID=584609 RepID=A0A238UD83_9FLAO|nr:ATP-binding protein [Tenacibaculum jejuense]SNR17015.1 putative Histidine kinase [Tenacibaculum jejuense]